MEGSHHFISAPAERPAGGSARCKGVGRFLREPFNSADARRDRPPRGIARRRALPGHEARRERSPSRLMVRLPPPGAARPGGAGGPIRATPRGEAIVM